MKYVPWFVLFLCSTISVFTLFNENKIAALWAFNAAMCCVGVIFSEWSDKK